MAESKPFASLSSGLLARKGGAKPAMRPQGYTHFTSGTNLEDLGWNDMGQFPEHVPTPIDALTPSPAPRPHLEVAPDPEPEEEACYDDVPEPAVVEQQRALQHSFEAEPESEPEPECDPEPEPEPAAEVVPLPKRASPRKASPVPSPIPARAKAAFTLRLDPDRHLKLRLACALSRRSAQQLVTEALDEFLNSLPEVEALAGRIPAESHKRSGRG